MDHDPRRISLPHHPYGIESIIRMELLEFWPRIDIADPDAVDVEISLLIIHWFTAILPVIAPIIHLVDKRLYGSWTSATNGSLTP